MSPLTVLVVDDDEFTRKLAAERLERRGLRVLRASDGLQGLSTAQNERPDLVLLDIQMPGMTGFEVLHALRGDAALAGIKVVAMTASVMPEDQGRMEREGFDAVLAKPFRRNELLRVVGAQLGRNLDEAP
jgi:two-component system cell cycle response regulator DivK